MSVARSITPTGDDYFEHDADIGVVGRGATLTMLQVKQEREGWRARCVVDV